MDCTSVYIFPVSMCTLSKQTPKLEYWLPKIEKYAQQVWDQEVANYNAAQNSGAKKVNSKYFFFIGRNVILMLPMF